MDKIVEFFKKVNDNGIPLPLARDNATGKGSVSLTMLWISFNVALFLLLGKVTNLTGTVDYQSVLWFYGITASFFFGRKFQKTAKGDVIFEGKDEEKKDA